RAQLADHHRARDRVYHGGQPHVAGETRTRGPASAQPGAAPRGLHAHLRQRTPAGERDMPATELATGVQRSDTPANHRVTEHHAGPARTRRDAWLALCLDRGRRLERDGENDEERDGADRLTHPPFHTARGGPRERE